MPVAVAIKCDGSHHKKIIYASVLLGTPPTILAGNPAKPLINDTMTEAK